MRARRRWHAGHKATVTWQACGGLRTALVDSVLDLPEVRASVRLEATVSLGDTEALQRLRERTKDAVTRPAGSTALVDAAIRA